MLSVKWHCSDTGTGLVQSRCALRTSSEDKTGLLYRRATLNKSLPLIKTPQLLFKSILKSRPGVLFFLQCWHVVNSHRFALIWPHVAIIPGPRKGCSLAGRVCRAFTNPWVQSPVPHASLQHHCTWEVEAGGSEAQGCLWLHKELKNNLDYMRPWLKTRNSQGLLNRYVLCMY